MRLNKTELSDAILGSFDGLTNVVGLGAGLMVRSGSLLFTIFLFCLVNCVGMSAARFISSKSVRQSAVMGIFSFCAGFLPAIPLFFTRSTLGVGLASMMAIAVTSVIGFLKFKLDADKSALSAFAETFGVVLLVCGIAIVASII